MVATLRGIYHNLNESKYVISNGEITYFFSSETYLLKYLETYKINRMKMGKHSDFGASKYEINVGLDFTGLHDLLYYRFIEKRGFRVMLKGVNLKWQESVQFALRKMIEPNTSDYQRTQSPNLTERLKIME